MSHVPPPPTRRRGDRHHRTDLVPAAPTPGSPGAVAPSSPGGVHEAGGSRARRHRRRRGRRWIVVTVVVLALTAAGAALGVWSLDRGASAPQSGAQSGSALDNVLVSGRQGATPVVTVTSALHVVDAKYRTLIEGTGRTITRDSPVVLSVTAFDGATGNILSASGPGMRVSKATTEALGDQLAGAVVGATEGSRLVFLRAIDPSERASGATSDLEIDVVDVMSSVADGKVPATASPGPLSVSLADDGPVITHTGAAPSELTTQVLLQGSGTQVASGDRVVAQYIVTGWSTGTVRSSTWSTGMPELITLDSTMAGLRDALIDQRVGSRIAVTIPPDLAEGDDTLCVVVDILGTQRPTQ